MPKDPNLSLNPEAGMNRTFVRGGFAPRAASLMRLLIGSTALTGVAGLVVGSLGSGTLTITNGGTVSNLGGLVGSFAGATGAVTVSGAGSTWTNTTGLDIGYFGSGTVAITHGGIVTTAGPANIG